LASSDNDWFTLTTSHSSGFAA